MTARVAPLADLPPLARIEEIADRLGAAWSVERTRRWLQALNREADGAMIVPNGRRYLVNMVALERWSGMRSLLHERELPLRVAEHEEQIEEHGEELEDLRLRVARLERPPAWARTAKPEALAPLASAVRQLLDEPRHGGRWQGEPSHLFEVLSALVPETVRRLPTWPKSARTLSRALPRMVTFLRMAGVHIDDRRAGRRHVWTLERMEQPVGSLPFPLSPEAKTPNENGDGYGDGDGAGSGDGNGDGNGDGKSAGATRSRPLSNTDAGDGRFLAPSSSVETQISVAATAHYEGCESGRRETPSDDDDE